MFCILIRVCCGSELDEPLLDGDQFDHLDTLTDVRECDRDNLEAGPGRVECGCGGSWLGGEEGSLLLRGHCAADLGKNQT